MSYEEEPRYCVNCGQPLTNAALAQIRVMSVSRLYGNAIGQISRADFKAICKGFDNLYHFDFETPLG